MQVASLEQHEALAKEVKELRGIIHQLLNAPLALEWVTLSQAGILLGGKCYQTVSKMCKSKVLESKQDGRSIYVKLESIRNYNTSKILS